ncbi:WD40/YVTN/BNR-like repeat-containing protein [Aquimarina mytili]|uniref:Oxidoreductase n=1 Tax=Aquimarina mytili TaxID=874423 RepID=A0A936ZY61_9FLAO|nr:oxidoreductase [Aquimarina mytili]MBL0684471.1 oxidoreductase [Aquimarina mytili]
MRYIIIVLVGFGLAFCNTKDEAVVHNFSEVNINVIYEDSISIRAIDIYNDTLLGFGFDRGYGFINLETHKRQLSFFEDVIDEDQENWIAQQRAVNFTNGAFYTLGIGSPARLRKIDLHTREEKVVYTEDHEKAFYDAIAFWNTTEGIAMGDPTDGCLSIIMTRDGGKSWKKIPCDRLPGTVEGEAAFAASNGNIAIVGDHTWIVSGGKKSRVFYSPDKGETWNVFETPIVQGTPTKGAYSIHFYDKNNGVIYGGDYTKPDDNKANKAITTDGGKTWKLISNGIGPGYKSCIRYVPKSGGKELVCVGFTGISISNDFGQHWKELSKEGFYTLRFVNDSTAVAAGKGRIAKIIFK